MVTGATLELAACGDGVSVTATTAGAYSVTISLSPTDITKRFIRRVLARLVDFLEGKAARCA